MFQVILVTTSGVTTRTCKDLEQALSHARYLKAIYFGVSNSEPCTDAIIHIDYAALT